MESLVTEEARVNTEAAYSVSQMMLEVLLLQSQPELLLEGIRLLQQLRLLQGSQLMVQIEGMLLMCRFMLLVCAINLVAAERERSTEARIQRRI